MISARPSPMRSKAAHVQIGVDVARKYKESADVIHAIEAHHNDVEPRTVVAALVQAADAFPPPVPARGVRMWRTTSSVWKSWKRSPRALTVWIPAMPSRQAVRSAL